ncbi:MAG: hypothetical protein K6G79_07995 [Bacteroidales bacterium]|nr:hypothetical protein [Bacteroidales bacterium]
MGLLFKKKTKLGLDRKKVVASYFVLGVCILLMAVNVGSFIFFPRLMAPLAILLSNAITLILAIVAFRPINALVENLLEKRQQELLEQQQKEQDLEKKVDMLENRNRELENRLDTRAQTTGTPADIDFTFKLEQMEYAKKGYVVKEEPLEDFLSDERYRHMIPDVSLWSKMLDALMIKDQGVRKILYIKKYYYKVSIGIDFSHIKFSFDGDRLFFSGVKFTRLHDITSELEPDSGDISHCWVLNTLDNWAEIKHSTYYDMFKEAYTRMQDAETRESLESEVATLCSQYTDIFRRNIQNRFPQVDFVDGIEQSDRSWFALREGGNYQMVREVASNMLLLTNVMNETKQIEEKIY